MGDGQMARRTDGKPRVRIVRLPPGGLDSASQDSGGEGCGFPPEVKRLIEDCRSIMSELSSPSRLSLVDESERSGTEDEAMTIATPMKRLAWATDIHLNFCSRQHLSAFYREVREAEVDALLVGGDIAEADTLEAYLLALRDHVGVPVYFVLGNHDFYRGSVADVRRRVAALTAGDDRLDWMPGAGVVELSPKVALIGHDGFYDAKLGDPWGSRVQLSDFFLIRELAWLEKGARFARLEEFGREAAAFLQNTLSLALERYEQIILLTHVPPFREACWHEGEISADDWLPFFTSKAAGDAITEVTSRHPDRDVVVLCGHTHGEGEAVILPNLRALTGGAVYGAPHVYAIVTIDARGFASVMPR